MKQTIFVGRKDELKSLELLLTKKSASLVVIQGRRRIGKSRLAQEFGKRYKFFHFSGLPPQSTTTAQSQRDEFMRQLSAISHFPEITVDYWSKAFSLQNSIPYMCARLNFQRIKAHLV